ncbi:Sulfite exporter TauE/SafE [uncultured archaeon]|nr:Sulfite exporter TauE/SafE [uncultured archaeon]
MDPVIIAFIVVLSLSGVFALLGLGGASIYVPIFFWLGIPLEQAIPAGLFLNVVSTGVSSFNYRGMFNPKAAFWILAGVLVGAPIGVWLSGALPQKLIIGLFALVLILAALRMIFGKIKQAKKDGAIQEGEAGFVEEIGASVLGISITRGAAGSLTGVISGTLGIGGGVFLVPFLIETGFQPKKAAVLSTFVVFFASLFSLLGHAAMRSLDYNFLIMTGAAALIGAFFGSRMMAQGKVDDALVKKAFAVILILFGLKLAADFFALP